MGITAIEMAEKRPPLFEMNTMSALYHIPQNDPPTLTNPSAWSATFNDFLRVCLKKAPEERPRAAELAGVRCPDGAVRNAEATANLVRATGCVRRSGMEGGGARCSIRLWPASTRAATPKSSNRSFAVAKTQPPTATPTTCAA